MQTAGVLTGYPDGSFLPQNPLTRAEAATLLCRFLKAAEDKTEPTEPTETEPTEPEPTEPEPTEPEPTEPKEPIHVTFVSEHSAAYVEGKAVTELTLPENVNFVEFIAALTKAMRSMTSPQRAAVWRATAATTSWPV